MVLINKSAWSLVFDDQIMDTVCINKEKGEHLSWKRISEAKSKHRVGNTEMTDLCKVEVCLKSNGK